MLLSLISIVVRDYDEAIAFYVGKLGFDLVEDTALTPEKRWVVVSPSRQAQTHILLATAVGERQRQSIGDQAGGRVFLFLQTDDFARDHREMIRRGVRFLEAPRTEPYGIAAVFEDLYGNRWDLIQKTDGSRDDPE
jgi:catechol 2,3-dioxygenase-like lactoylglutathione lyase family enzyme